MPDAPPSSGSSAFRTVHRALADEPSEVALEFPFYTDTHIMGTGSYGPFELLNPVRIDRRTDVAAVVLRVEFHLPRYVSELPTDQGNEHYHGGGIEDEVAALTSLELGVRMKAGPASRRFELDEDPRGSPVAYEQALRDSPQLPRAGSRPVIPSLLRDATLGTRLLQRLTEISPSGSVKLTRSARLYQDAVWIADSAPELSWLLLVSAIETAAVHWRTEGEDTYESVRSSGSPLVKAVRDAGGEELLQTLAPQLAELTGSTGPLHPVPLGVRSERANRGCREGGGKPRVRPAGLEPQEPQKSVWTHLRAEVERAPQRAPVPISHVHCSDEHRRSRARGACRERSDGSRLEEI